ncbi:hypothetical protein [Actinomyces naeslundii]|uniref:hypothetical protein n=1 Tax=Actinomyces naeslundii TaxID=1655 RepID=UPI001177E2C7|nr:hypothetical protein [Actinomyces naeslundii]
MSHNFQEVIDELHRGRELLTSTSGTQGKLDDLSAVLSNVCGRVSTYCSDAAQDAAENLATAQDFISNITGGCTVVYSNANKELIINLHGESNFEGQPPEAQHHGINSQTTGTANNNSINRSQNSNSINLVEADDRDTKSSCADSAGAIKRATDPIRLTNALDDERSELDDKEDYLNFEQCNDVLELLKDRDEAIQVRNEKQDTLRRHLPPGITIKHCSRKNIRKTLDRLRPRYGDDMVDKIKQLADDLSYSRGIVCKISARIGEVGGENYVTNTKKLLVLPSFLASNTKTPGKFRVDCVATNKLRNIVFIVEYKGIGARTNRTPVKTEFFGRRPQGTVEYAQDRLLKDDRVAEELYKDTKVCENFYRNKINFAVLVISTSKKGEPRPQLEIHFGKLDPRVRARLKNKIDNLKQRRS